ncbi:MAG TPA: MFS transporter [Exilispira sp.]|nr:MFS transporter [Exilispira sp.]
MEQINENQQLLKKKAILLIILFGIISLFGDIIYEGARSIYGPYTKSIGMDIALVGLITGLAEFFGYFIRLISGYFADKSKGYWTFTIIGYFLLITVPLMGMSTTWQVISVFIIFERIGKAIRSPAKDTILSSATKQIGTGFGFAIHEAMDQLGAIVGPLIFSLILLLTKKDQNEIIGYKKAFLFMFIPFTILMASVIISKIKVPHPEKLEKEDKNIEEKLSKTYWLYSIFTTFTTMGFISFAILGYYFKEKNILNDAQIPFYYAIAMAVDGLAALIIGRLYDKIKNKYNNSKAGLKTLIVIPILTLFIPILSFAGKFWSAIASIMLWGIVMGCHETIMKSSIADLTHLKKRGTGYGIFNTFYGISFFIAGSLFGFLYKINFYLIIGCVVLFQIISVVIYFILLKSINMNNSY